jgi:hypothetical protein
MAVEAHVEGLTTRHQKLEQEIEQALAHPSSDPLEIAKLKRKKLRLKDEINKLQSEIN